MAVTRVLIEPSRIKNCSRFSFLNIDELIIAAWLEPSPGRKEQMGEIRIVANVGLNNSFLSMWNFSRDCSGGVVFDFIEYIIVDVPNNPVKSGRSGCCKSKLKVANPKNPARIKIRRDFSFSFSV